ncbi:MAG: polysaccharide biosynthesis/export family protein, partial [Bacteroidota bacterium]
MKSRVAFVSLFLMFWGLLVLLVAQTSQRPLGQERQSERGSLISLPTGSDEMLARPKTVPMEGAIDPATYVVGPNDMLLVALWGPLSFALRLTVTPEGTLIIPTVGEVKVVGMSLADAKVEVSRVVRTKYIAGEVSVTLISPREFIVRLRGAVLREGEYVVSAVDRVEKVLVEGAGLEPLRATLTVPPLDVTTGDPLSVAELRAPNYRAIAGIDDRASIRNIRLIRRTGDTIRVDIPRFYVTRDDRYNPFLLDGDIIVVPQRHLSRNFVTIDGAVNAPSRYEFAEGDDLLSLLEIAQGFTVVADKKNVVIIRLDETGDIA